MAKSKKSQSQDDIKSFDFIMLVEIVKKKKDVSDSAYKEIEFRMKSKIGFLVNKFYIPGYSKEDIHQESLFALRYKAIPDYNKEVIGRNGQYPFDKFAVLCIRRHLSTLLKTCYQNKKRVLNTSLSLNQDRQDDSNSSNDELTLKNILPQDNIDILNDVSDKEYYFCLFVKLHSKLSRFEKKVFKLYIQKYSYEEMASVLTKYYKKHGIKKRIIKKNIDNALSRIKQKAKEIYKKHG